MNILVYAPNSLFSPERELIHQIIMKKLEEGHNVTVLYCKGGACSINPLGLRKICNVCVKCSTAMSENVEKITGPENLNFQYYENSIKSTQINSDTELKKQTYKKEDIGYAVLSTYIGITRDYKPNLHNSTVLKYLNRLASTFISTYEEILYLVKKYRFEEVNLFNGRLNNTRAALRAARSQNVNVYVHEVVGLENKTQVFLNELPHNIEANQFKISKLYEKYKMQAREIAREFYSRKRRGEAVNDKSYTSKQDINALPNGFDKNVKNIVFFTSSEDEFKAIGKEWEEGIYDDQIYAIRRLSELASKIDAHLYVRVHPNVKFAHKSYRKSIMSISHPSLTLIGPDSEISSYRLLDDSDIVITNGSTIGIEGAFWRKPSILLSTSFYKGLGSTYEPKTEAQLLELLESNHLQPLDDIGAIKMAVFYVKNGEFIDGFEGNKSEGYSCFGSKIKLTKKDVASYRTGKVFEKIYNTLFLK